jgi:hypothetical protein
MQSAGLYDIIFKMCSLFAPSFVEIYNNIKQRVKVWLLS